MSEIIEPIEGPVATDESVVEATEVPQLGKVEITLDDGHMVGVTTAGAGIPLVVVHGFSAEGFLYAQSLSRLVNMGFRVIAIDTAGHGATQGLPLSGMKMDDYADLLGRVIDHLGITRYVLAGHSMGGQLIARLGASRPEQVLGIIFIDAIVGDTWDRMVYLFRVSPPLLAVIAGILVVDSVSVLPTFSNPVQAAKLFRLVVPTVWGHMTRPWRLAGPALSIMRTRSSRYALNTLKDNSVTCVAIHGSLDLAVPHMTAIDTVNRTSGTLVTIDGGGHSWILRDPETLPAILAELLEGDLGKAISSGLRQAGLRRAPARRPQVARNVEGRNGSGNNGSGHNGDGVAESTAWVGKGIRTADIEAVCYNPDAMIFDLAPPDVPRKTRVRQRAPRYRWSTL